MEENLIKLRIDLVDLWDKVDNVSDILEGLINELNDLIPEDKIPEEETV